MSSFEANIFSFSIIFLKKTLAYYLLSWRGGGVVVNSKVVGLAPDVKERNHFGKLIQQD
jgi:hypothetical protein